MEELGKKKGLGDIEEKLRIDKTNIREIPVRNSLAVKIFNMLADLAVFVVIFSVNVTVREADFFFNGLAIKWKGGGKGPAIKEKISVFFVVLVKTLFYFIDDVSKYQYSSVHVIFCCRSAKSLSFNWLVKYLPSNIAL